MKVIGGFAGKLAGGFVVLLLLLGGAEVLSIRELARSAAERETIGRQLLEDVIYAERLRAAGDASAAAERGFLITRSSEFLHRLEEAKISFDRALGELRARVSTPTGKELVERVTKEATDYSQAEHRIILEAGKNADPEAIRRLFEREVVPRRLELNEAIDELIAHKDIRLAASYEETRKVTSRAITASALRLSLAVLASALFAWAMVRHLTKVYRREQEAVRSAERAIAARDELLGIVAHDLRNPLNAITMKAALLRKSTAEEKTAKQAESIEGVAMRMEHLIKSLLDVASIEVGQLSVRPSPCEVAKTLQEAFDLLGPLALPKSIRLEARLEPPDLWVKADRERVIQVLINLVANALKFSFDGSRVDVTVEQEGDFVRFSVADTGPGIAPSHLPHVFERFWKNETDGKRGTGLGLYIAKGIVEAHGGHIWVESQLGHGATFHFTLPSSFHPAANPRSGGERKGGGGSTGEERAQPGAQNGSLEQIPAERPGGEERERGGHPADDERRSHPRRQHEGKQGHGAHSQESGQGHQPRTNGG